MSPARGFLSYAHEDRDTAIHLYAALVDRGHRLWFDQVDFRSEESVDSQILNAIRESRYFVLLLTPLSISKDGYIRREIRLALDMIRDLRIESAFIIPVRAEYCEPRKEELGGLTQFIDLYRDWDTGVSALAASIPTQGYIDLLQSGPHAIQVALADVGYLAGLATSLRDRSAIGVTLDNALVKTQKVGDMVLSRKLIAMRRNLADFAACIELHFTHNCGEQDPRTVCLECNQRGTVVHGTIDLGGKSPMDYNDNYISWCVNCFWASYSFEVDYVGRGPLQFDYQSNEYR